MPLLPRDSLYLNWPPSSVCLACPLHLIRLHSWQQPADNTSPASPVFRIPSSPGKLGTACQHKDKRSCIFYLIVLVLTFFYILWFRFVGDSAPLNVAVMP